MEIIPEDFLSFVKDHGEISSGEYANHFGVTARTALRHLNGYVEDGILGKEGEKKGAKYFLIGVDYREAPVKKPL